MIRERRGANSISPRNRRVEAYDNSVALREEWISFFKDECESLKDSEKEHNDEEIINFCWPTEVLDIINNEAEIFIGSLLGIARLRDEINFLVRKTLMKQEPTDGKLVSENSWVHIKEDGQVIKEEHKRINDAEASDSGDAEEGKNFELMSNKSSSPAKEEGRAAQEQSDEEVLEDVQEFGANLSGLTN